MNSTTVKLDGSVLKMLKEIKPPEQKLTSLVRELLESELRRRKMKKAATKYAEFLSRHQEETQELDAWATAPLDKSKSGKPPR